MRPIALIAGTVLAADAARADLSVRFVEGAPKDRFIVENLGACPIGSASVTLDLTASRGGLYFDVTAKGAGVSVYQPVEIERGAAFVAEMAPVPDGATSVGLMLRDLPPGEAVVLTTDLDDRTGQGATIVGDAEIAGAAVIIAVQGERISGYFGKDAGVRLALPPCPTS